MAVDPIFAAGGFLVVTLIVGAVGVALGILLAPRIGRLAERADREPPLEEPGDDPRS